MSDEGRSRTETGIMRMLDQHAPRKAIEPDAFTSPSHEARKRQGIASAIGNVSTNEGWMTKIEIPKWNPNFYMRMLGYTANPMTCPHMHKRFKTRWLCADCGEELPNE